MSERPDPTDIKTDETYRVWSVTEFAARHRLDEREEQRLLQLFGPFATTCELMHNARREPRWH